MVKPFVIDAEYLGEDEDGNEYWRVGSDVLKQVHGVAEWLCTYAAWPTYLRLVDVG